MIQKILTLFLGTKKERDIKKFIPVVEKINALESQFEKLSDDELKANTDSFKNRVANGEKLDKILPEAFAAVREASKRTLSMRHFDVQLMGGGCLAPGEASGDENGRRKNPYSNISCIFKCS